MSNIVTLLLAVLFAASAAFAVLEPTPPGCQLKVVNSGAPGYPNYGATTCVGDCVSPDPNPCLVDIFAGGDIIQFRCRCNGKVPLKNACAAILEYSGGVWDIMCFQGQCRHDCNEATLPNPDDAVIACTCPDA